MDAPALTRIKVCGITSLDDAERCVDLGAWALGMIFVRGSRRRCRPAEAEAIAAGLRRRVELCGVFVNATLDEVAHAAERFGLSLLQLHGDEGPAYCQSIGRRTGCRVIKAVPVRSRADVQALRPYRVDYHLLDSAPTRLPATRLPDHPSVPDGERGGTGRTFDWSLVRGRKPRAIPLILSGGLNADNVAEAIAATEPFAVDTASGTEGEEPGVKDPDRLAAFVRAVRAATPAEASVA